MTQASGDGALSEVPWSSGALYVILSSSMIGIMGVSLISPVLPAMRPAFGVTDSQVGLVITAYTVPGIVLTPVVGLVADRIGRRRVLVPLLVLFGVAGAAIAVAETFTQVLFLRFLQGVGASALITLAITLIGDLYDGQQRNAVMGLHGSILGTSGAFYPLVGGVLGTIRWSVPFLFFAIAIGVGLFATVTLREPERGDPQRVGAYLERLGRVLLLPAALAIFAAIFVIFTVFYGAVLTALPLLLADDFGLGSDGIGFVIAAVAIASAIVSSQFGRISQWREPEELVALGFLAYGASLIGVWLAPTPALVGVALLAFGVGFGIVMPSVDTAVVTLVSGDLRAGMMSMRTSVLSLGKTVGPFLFTFIAETWFPTTIAGYRTLLVVSGILVATTGAVGYVLVRR